MRAEIALMSGSAFAVTHHAFSSGAGRTSDGNGSHASTLKSPSYTKSVSWQHYRFFGFDFNPEVIAKMTGITGVGGGIFLLGLFITFIFKKDGSIYDGKTINQNNKGE